MATDWKANKAWFLQSRKIFTPDKTTMEVHLMMKQSFLSFTFSVAELILNNLILEK